MEQILKNLLKDTGFRVASCTLAERFGWEAAILLSYLIGKEDYFAERGKLDPDGFFYRTHEAIEKDIFLSAYKQRDILKQLVKAGVIETRYRDLPKKLWYRVNYDGLALLLGARPVDVKTAKNFPSECQKTSRQEVKEFDVCTTRVVKKSRKKEKTINTPSDEECLLGHPSEKKAFVRTKQPFKASTQDFLSLLPKEWQGSAELSSRLADYLEGWTQRGRPVIKKQAEVQAHALVEHSGGNIQKAIGMVEKSTNGCWVGFYKPEEGSVPRMSEYADIKTKVFYNDDRPEKKDRFRKNLNQYADVSETIDLDAEDGGIACVQEENKIECERKRKEEEENKRECERKRKLEWARERGLL